MNSIIDESENAIEKAANPTESTNETVNEADAVDNTPKLKNPGVTSPDPQSKSQLKRLKKQLTYQARRKERRIKERQKLKEKRRLAVAQGLPAQNGPSRKELKRRQLALEPKSASIKIAIDLDYDELMSEHDTAKCVKQCLRIYTINRRSEHPGELNFTGIQKDGRIHNAFKRHDGWENWHVRYYFEKNHIEAFESDKLIYLTCESDNVLEKLEDNKIYVIGGLVDHNHHKGVCHERAVKAGLKTARLPLSEHVDMKTRAVLSTFHVFELLLRVASGSSWTDSILATIPTRKGAKPKEAALSKADSIPGSDNIVDINKDSDKIDII